MKNIRRLLILAILIFSTAFSWAADSFRLTLLHTNDLHGMMLPFDYTYNPTYANKDTGGLARRAVLIKQIRESTKDRIVVIDCGDLFTRGPWHKKFFGTPEIEALNLMDYDMLCVGNNEFKATSMTDSQDIMLGLMRRSDFPWLAANLTVGDTGVPVEGIHPFIVRDFGSIRVGFLGLTAPRSKDYAQTEGWTISDPIEAASKWVPIARKECDILIAVTHIGASIDEDLASKVPGIDAVIGGDSHTFIPEARMITGPSGKKVPVVQAGEQGVVLGRLDLTLDNEGGWHVIDVKSCLIPVDLSIPEDSAMKKLLERWIAPPVEPAEDKVSWNPFNTRAPLPALN